MRDKGWQEPPMIDVGKALVSKFPALSNGQGLLVQACSIDPDFGDCLDLLCMADLKQLKASKRQRYLGRPLDQGAA